MSVYSPTGSGNVHIDKVISGGRRRVASGSHPGFKAVANKIAKKQGVPMKQAQAELAASTRRAGAAAKKANPNLKKVAAKKASPKAMADMNACPPGSMSTKPRGGGLGVPTKKAAPKAAAKKAVPKKMTEPGTATTRQQRMEHTTAKRAVRTTKATGKRTPSQSRIPQGGGSPSTTGSRTY